LRRAAKVDANQAEIVAALRAVGATVTPLHAVGQGCPDILAGYGGLNFLLEVKDGAKPPSARKLTPDQVSWHDTWRGQVAVASSVKEALKIIGALRGEVS
jgi:Holliday junction resolvase